MRIKVWQLGLALGALGVGTFALLGPFVAAALVVGLLAAIGLGAWLAARQGPESDPVEHPAPARAHMIAIETAPYEVRTWYPRCSRGCHVLVNAHFDPHTGESQDGSPAPARRETRSVGETFERSWKLRVALLAAIAAVGSVAVSATAAGSKSGRDRAAGVDAANALLADNVPLTLDVPQVRSNAFVFAKIILSDTGFAWRVCGSTQGYPGNLVVSQSPVAGTHVSTAAGTPVVRLWLGPNRSYREHGVPAESGPFSAFDAWSASKSSGTRPAC